MKILDNSTDLIIYAGESREELCYSDTGGGLFLKIGERYEKGIGHLQVQIFKKYSKS